MANIELLKRLRTRFLRMRHKKHLNMKVVAKKTDCGAAMCIGGHTLELAGYKMRLKEKLASRNVGDYGRLDFNFISPDGLVVSDPLRAAAAKLGLEWHEYAHPLFHDFSLKTPKQAAARIEALIKDLAQEAHQ